VLHCAVMVRCEHETDAYAVHALRFEYLGTVDWGGGRENGRGDKM